MEVLYSCLLLKAGLAHPRSVQQWFCLAKCQTQENFPNIHFEAPKLEFVTAPHVTLVDTMKKTQKMNTTFQVHLHQCQAESAYYSLQPCTQTLVLLQPSIRHVSCSKRALPTLTQLDISCDPQVHFCRAWHCLQNHSIIAVLGSEGTFKGCLV